MDTQSFTSFEVSGLFYPTKGVGGKRYDPCVMHRRRWFGKGDSFKIWQFLVSMLDFWGVFFDFCFVFFCFCCCFCFRTLLIFTPILGDTIQFDKHILQKWVETTNYLAILCDFFGMVIRDPFQRLWVTSHVWG